MFNSAQRMGKVWNDRKPYQTKKITKTAHATNAAIETRLYDGFKEFLHQKPAQQ
jgi:cytochrome c556